MCYYVKSIESYCDFDIDFLDKKNKKLSKLYTSVLSNQNVGKLETEASSCGKNIDLAYALIFEKEFLI